MKIQNTASQTVNSKFDWLFPGQYFPILGLVSVSLPAQSPHFMFHKAVIL